MKCTLKQENNIKTMTNKFKIEKGVPVPSFESKYPFSKMEIGDSFFAKKISLAGSITCAEARLGYKFKQKFIDGGTRVWRVE